MYLFSISIQASRLPIKVSADCHERSSRETNIRKRIKSQLRVSRSDRKKDVVWKTSRWSSSIEAAFHESNPCFSSLSISHSSLASTSQLRFKELDAAFDLQLKFQSSSCLPLNTCVFLLHYVWSGSQSYPHIIPSGFQFSLSQFSEEDLPISFGNLTTSSLAFSSLTRTHTHWRL